MAAKHVERVAVLGAGTMGHGIAQVAATAGCRVTLYDIDESIVAKGRSHVAANLARGIEKGKVTEEQKAAALERLATTTTLAEAVRDADLVVEAAPERMDLKKRIFAEVSGLAPEGAILATNTSSLSITEIAAASRRPDRVLGMHFFNPPYILKLLELVRAEQTSDEVLEQARQAGERMGREMIVVSDTPGFATSRLGLVLGLEAMRMVEQGVAGAAEIDRAMELGYGHAMGPLRVTDLVGLDVRLAIAQYLHAELGGDQYRPPQILRRLVRAGKLGRKTGEGFYRW
jgi:3-hydroxybutyryl-CoA dehydrogenase